MEKEYTGFKTKLGLKIYDGDEFEFEYVYDGTQEIKATINWNEKVGAWYLGGEMLSNVIHEQNNDEWKKSVNFEIRKEQYI